MPCFKPLHGYMSRTPSANGKFGIVFNVREGWVDRPMVIPCGQCIGCRLDKSLSWATRCLHEASLHEENCFITLTYNDEFCPIDGSLNKRDWQLFMKRLRKKFGGRKIRYFHCGEYGSQLDRPHYHACLFGFDFPDKVLWSFRKGVRLYRSAILESLWTHPGLGCSLGFSTIGDVTFESAAYVARYCLKKVTGKMAKDHYVGRLPEYITMSRRPGIAAKWIDQFASDVYPHDFIVTPGGRKVKPSRYYDEKYDLTNHLEMAIIKGKRERGCRDNPDIFPRRLKVRRKIAELSAERLERSYETNGVCGV